MKKYVAIHSAKKAIRDYNKKMKGFSDIMSRMRIPMDDQGSEIDSQNESSQDRSRNM